jgi:PIN domain nuclease of toxin-antitoxin system
MALLLDTHILLALLRDEVDKLAPDMQEVVRGPGAERLASAARLWETAIKTRLGKLHPGMLLADIPGFLESLGIALLPIDHRHALAAVDPEPGMRDPFDRLLLGQCAVEGMRLVTLDRALADHPLAWREA